MLSGRLMGEILFVRRLALPTFFYRRVTRIIPALYAFLLLILIGDRFVPEWRAQFGSIVASATFTINYLDALGAGFNAFVLDHVWSLCVEEHTYLALGLLAWVSIRLGLSPWKTSALLALACMLNGVYLTLAEGRSYYAVYWRTDARAQGILLGCALFCCQHEHPRWFDWIQGRTLICLLAVALALSFNRVPDPIKYSIGTLLFAMCCVFVDRFPSIVVRPLSSRFLGILGAASFSIYLWQQPFFTLRGEYRSWLMLGAALVAGASSYRFVELPARRWLNRQISNRARALSPAEK